ncbi:MAG: hypothetical protein LBC12_04935 [Nitrososphaerota archaeon]|nr:hypothetical protein [Nitrososphaerota archaeon]
MMHVTTPTMRAGEQEQDNHLLPKNLKETGHLIHHQMTISLYQRIEKRNEKMTTGKNNKTI